MAITIENVTETMQAITVKVHETDRYHVYIVVIDGTYVAGWVNSEDPEYGPQGSVAYAVREWCASTDEGVREVLAELASEVVLKLEHWRAREALEAIGEAMELAD